MVYGMVERWLEYMNQEYWEQGTWCYAENTQEENPNGGATIDSTPEVEDEDAKNFQ